jgi:hypothetical protein
MERYTVSDKYIFLFFLFIVKKIFLYFIIDGSITTWRAYDIGKGALLSKDEVSKMCSIPQTDTDLIIQDGFKQPNTLEGKMKHDHVPTESNNRVFEVEPTADAIEHESVSIVSCANQDSFHCPEEDCTRIFQTFNGLELHQIFGKHKYVLNKSSTHLKKGDKSKAENYRPVSLISVVCKMLEHIICSSIMEHLDRHKFLHDVHHGFRKRRSCQSQLILTIQDLAKNIDKLI